MKLKTSKGSKIYGIHIRTKDPQWTVDYRYGYDGQRRLKYTQENRNETAYFNNMWQTSASANSRDWLQSKHIFVGESRIATKSNREVWESGTDNNLGFEINNQYWYHGDHLGSAQVVTERGGSLLERIEYTPYGEIWVEHKYDAAESSLPYRFTGKELDPETNFYYFGARYLDPRTSRWLSTDPAMGDYIPSAPINDEAKKRNGSLPGMGGVFNTVNLHVYHYAGNNPVKYVDPDGEKILPTRGINGNNFYQQDSNRNITKSETPVAAEGCYATANARVINAINALVKAIDPQAAAGSKPIGVNFTISQNEFFDKDLLDVESSGAMINKFTILNTTTTRVEGQKSIQDTLLKYSESTTEHAAIVGRIGSGNNTHFLNIEGVITDANGKITMVDVYDTSTRNRTRLSVSDLTAIDVTTWKPLGVE